MKPMLVVGFDCEMFCVLFFCCVAGLQTTLAGKKEKKKKKIRELMKPRTDLEI